MRRRKFFISGIVGGIAAFFGGFLIYVVALGSTLAANAGTATGVMRAEGEMVWWALIVGSLFMGLTKSYIFNKWANINKLFDGASTGAFISFLIACGYDFMMYGNSNLLTFQGTCIDIVASTALGAITGAAVGFMNGKIKE
jgi:hypothetical protein